MKAYLPMVAFVTGALLLSARAGAAAPADDTPVRMFLETHCFRCHGEQKAKGDVVLHKLGAIGKGAAELEVWKKVYDQLDNGEMPPPDAKQPTLAARQLALASIKIGLKASGVKVDELKAFNPARGNWVDHEALFSGTVVGEPGTPDRVWRVTNQAYLQFMERLNQQLRLFMHPSVIVPPWKLQPGHDFSDYSTTHRIGEAEIEIHLRNCEKVAQRVINGILGNRSSRVPLAPLVSAGKSASRPQVDALVKSLATSILNRPLTADEATRYGDFLAQALQEFPAQDAVAQSIITVLFHPDVLYRLEPVEVGRRATLSARHAARAIAFTLTDQEPDATLLKAVAGGQLESRQDIAKHVERILKDRTIRKPKLLSFFHEYFGYDRADDVFKCRTTLTELGLGPSQSYLPVAYVADANRLIGSILDADVQVLRELLTTPKTFVLTHRIPQRVLGTEAGPDHPLLKMPFAEFSKWKELHVVTSTYEVTLTAEDWISQRPVTMPEGHRLGILTHPSWLIAHSSNFDNHAIHRGRWIREKLLGGKVPDVPVTVDAALPDEPDNTLRGRMRVTRQEYCWNCHKLMDPLGLPFEQFDHIGRFRTAEQVVDKDATARRNSRTLVRTMKPAPLEVTGAIELSGDPKLEGPVANPFEMIRKLAGSERVEQVFVRHAFRYFLGRNETLADGPTLVAAHRAYRDHNGSLNALLLSLLTSDSFLVRTRDFEAGPTQPEAPNNKLPTK